jgi:hypothetical protein
MNSSSRECDYGVSPIHENVRPESAMTTLVILLKY